MPDATDLVIALDYPDHSFVKGPRRVRLQPNLPGAAAARVMTA